MVSCRVVEPSLYGAGQAPFAAGGGSALGTFYFSVVGRFFLPAAIQPGALFAVLQSHFLSVYVILGSLVPKLTLFFSDDFADQVWAGLSYALEAPKDAHGHGHRGEWILGRHPASDLTISLRDVSRSHCAVTYSYSADRWSVQDLGSTTGTTLRGKRLEQGNLEPIAPGDRLWVGCHCINVIENEDDTVGGVDDGPETIADVVPLDHRPQAERSPVATPRTYADNLDIVLQWMLAPQTVLGGAVRLVVVALVALVVVLIFD